MYVREDKWEGPKGFENYGWPMWKAIWGTGGALLGAVPLYYAPSLMNFIGFSMGAYGATNDVLGAATNKNLKYNQQIGKFDFFNNGAELIQDGANVIKYGRGNLNPANVFGVSTFILDNTFFKDKNKSDKKDKKTPPQKPKPKKKSSGSGYSRGITVF